MQIAHFLHYHKIFAQQISGICGIAAQRQGSPADALLRQKMFPAFLNLFSYGYRLTASGELVVYPTEAVVA